MKALNAFTTNPGGFMKKTLAFLSFVVILATMATLATAGSAVVLRGEIPFDFYVGDQMLPAGEYQFEMGRVTEATTSSVTVRSKDGKVLAFVPTRPGVSNGTTSNQIIFNSSGGNYVLASVESPGYKANLKKTKPVDQSGKIQLVRVLPLK